MASFALCCGSRPIAWEISRVLNVNLLKQALSKRWHKQSKSWHNVTGSGQMWFVNWSKPPYGKPPIHSDECSELHNAQSLRPRRLTRILSYSLDTGASTAEVEVDEHFIPKYMTHRDRRETAYCWSSFHCAPKASHTLSTVPEFYAIKNRAYETKRGHRAGFDVPVPACTFLFLGEFSLNI